MPKTGLYTRRALAVLGCAVMLGLSACSPPEPILKGTRISVLPEIQLGQDCQPS